MLRRPTLLAVASSLLLLISRSVFGAKEVRITNENKFSGFVNNVNKGTNYKGTTVYLDSDLSLSSISSSIGTGSSYQFRGVLDGQGHVISNLRLSSSTQYSGLFGYSTGLAIRNVVLDSSCSLTNSYSGSNYVYVGGIIGYCYSSNGNCSIENSVNMESITFSGSIKNYYLYLGGIVGYLQSSSSYISTMKNCANYGTILKSGKSGYSRIGGVVGYFYGTYSKNGNIYNCLNYGAITHSGTTHKDLYLGGIVGYTPSYAYIENCVSAGMISSDKENDYIGGIIGKVDSNVYINYCYYTSKLSSYNTCGSGTPTSTYCSSFNSNTFYLNEAVAIGDYIENSLINALNTYSEYYTLRDYSHWLLNKNSKTVSFTISSRANPIKMSYQIIILPSLANEGKVSFDGWYTNIGCTTPLTNYNIYSSVSLYGRFDKSISYTITFNTRGGTSVSPKQARFGATVSLSSSSTKDSCTVASWETEKGYNVGFNLIMPVHNITLYAVWKCTRIKTSDDFLGISKVVNKGTSYSGTTVYLDSDLSLSGYFINPIGDPSNQFRGVFDGQGHVISNLKISSSSVYTGLFGYSEGLTIRNLVLDSSCSIKNTHDGKDDCYIGGIIGYCSGQCNIENNVNMVSVTFGGSIKNYYLYLGGIVGYLQSSSSYISTMKNCANYGTILKSGKSGYSYIGGVVGYSYGTYSKNGNIYNCLDYGTITHSGTTSSNSYIGGITGYSYYTYIKNCLSTGKITSNKESDYIGSIVGYVSSYTYIYYSYFTSNTEINKLYGKGSPKGATGSPTTQTSVGSTLISNLNSQVTQSNGWNKWILNSKSKTISFKINNENSLDIKTQVILLPDPVNTNQRSFSGWYKDEDLTSLFTASSVSSATTLYGMFCGSDYTVTLDINGGDASSIPSLHKMAIECNGIYGTLPTPSRTEAKFNGWYTAKSGGSKVESRSNVTNKKSHILYAQWTINKYTVTFDFNNSVDNPERRTLEYDVSIEYPANIVKDEYRFFKWEPKPDNMPARDFTTTAQWIPLDRYILTFIFGNGKEPDVRDLVANKTFNYPEDPERTGYNFTGWDNNITKMPAENVIVTAQWTANTYTVSFDVNGGNELQNSSQTVTYDNTYGELPEPDKTGYTFTGWFTENDVSITNETTVDIPNSHTLYAHWNVIQYELTLVFNDGADPEVRTLDFDSTIIYPEHVRKEGYSFNGWDNKHDKMPAKDINVTALWTINNYTLTFNFNNGTNSESKTLLNFTAPIDYPENVTRLSHEFFGWDTNITNMPAYDLTIVALWNKTDSSSKSNSKVNSGVIVGIVVPLIVIIIAFVLFILFFVSKKKKEKEKKREINKPLIGYIESGVGYSRAITASGIGSEERISTGRVTGGTLSDIFSRGFEVPTMKEALVTAKLTEEQSDLIISTSKITAHNAMEKREKAISDEFTEDDAAAIAMYTYDLGKDGCEQNPRKIISRALIGKTPEDLQKASGVLYLVMMALRKLPRFTGVTLYRGVGDKTDLEEGNYDPGNVIMWPALTSTSPDMDKTKKALVKEAKERKTTGILFVIEGGWGYNVQAYSTFSDDAEVILEPERRFMVDSVTKSDGLTLVKIDMLDTPLLLPRVFGKGRDY